MKKNNERFTEEEYYTPICNYCKHRKMRSLSCKAFEKIPEEILLGEVSHNKILPNQIGDFIYIPK